MNGHVSPFWYGVGGLVAVPFVALICFVIGAGMLLAWPFVPFWLYRQRAAEVRASKEVK